MTPAKLLPGCFLAVALTCAAPPANAVARPGSHRHSVTRTQQLVTPTDLSASRRHTNRPRHATRIRIYRRGDYSFFEPYAPPVPRFFPFGYTQGYF